MAWVAHPSVWGAAHAAMAEQASRRRLRGARGGGTRGLGARRSGVRPAVDARAASWGGGVDAWGWAREEGEGMVLAARRPCGHGVQRHSERAGAAVAATLMAAAPEAAATARGQLLTASRRWLSAPARTPVAGWRREQEEEERITREKGIRFSCGI